MMQASAETKSRSPGAVEEAACDSATLFHGPMSRHRIHLEFDVTDSPSSVEIDREDKFVQYREAGVANYWIVDPALKTIDAWKLIKGQYVSVGRAQGNDTIKLPPFPDLEIPLARLWRPQRD